MTDDIYNADKIEESASLWLKEKGIKIDPSFINSPFVEKNRKARDKNKTDRKLLEQINGRLEMLICQIKEMDCPHRHTFFLEGESGNQKYKVAICNNCNTIVAESFEDINNDR